VPESTQTALLIPGEVVVGWDQGKHGTGRSYKGNNIRINIHRSRRLSVSSKSKELTSPKSDRRACLGQRIPQQPVRMSTDDRSDGVYHETNPLSICVANVGVRVLFNGLEGAKAFTISCKLANLKVIFRKGVGNVENGIGSYISD
jgi:hypothetical protein